MSLKWVGVARWGDERGGGLRGRGKHARQGPVVDGVGRVHGIGELAVYKVENFDEFAERGFEVGRFVGLQRQTRQKEEYKQSRHALPKTHSQL